MRLPAQSALPRRCSRRVFKLNQGQDSCSISVSIAVNYLASVRVREVNNLCYRRRNRSSKPIINREGLVFFLFLPWKCLVMLLAISPFRTFNALETNVEDHSGYPHVSVSCFTVMSHESLLGA
jgi:hypothetical protein